MLIGLENLALVVFAIIWAIISDRLKGIRLRGWPKGHII